LLASWYGNPPLKIAAFRSRIFYSRGDSTVKKTRYTESQIFQILKEAENGIPIPELCRKHGMSDASFYKWRAKYGGMDVSNMTASRSWRKKTAD
jgi:putative transposase